MKIPIPSFRTQIILLVLFLVINSALFFRNYFLDSFQDYSMAMESLDVNQKINELYKNYGSQLSKDSEAQFKMEVEAIMSMEWQRALARDLFKKEISLYSKFIFVFLTVTVLILFFVSFNLVNHPLRRLQAATLELSKGNWNIQVRESRFSPLNDLIKSFNAMILELDSSRKQLIQAEKEMAWREMARVLAHEIKNPLTPIRLSLERLEHKFRSRSADLDKVFNNVSSVIHEEVRNLQTLASEFSQFARLPVAVPEEYDLNGQLADIITPYEDRAGFELDLEKNLPPLYADRAQMKQVFVNLIQNGIQAADSDPFLTVTTRNDSARVSVGIRDNGSGIDDENLDKIFDPYFTRREKGTGLGLAIVKRIVENHEGTIRVESHLNQGTEFVLSFPLNPTKLKQ